MRVNELAKEIEKTNNEVNDTLQKQVEGKNPASGAAGEQAACRKEDGRKQKKREKRFWEERFRKERTGTEEHREERLGKKGSREKRLWKKRTGKKGIRK